MSRVFADSLYWIALSHQRDQWHVADGNEVRVMWLPRVRLRVWHLLAAVALEGLIAGEVAWIFRSAQIHGRPIVVEDSHFLIAFIVTSIGSFIVLGILGITAILVRLTTKNAPWLRPRP